MIFKVPESTKVKLVQLNNEINTLTAIRQSIVDTICDINNYSGTIRSTVDGDLETIEEPKS